MMSSELVCLGKQGVFYDRIVVTRVLSCCEIET